MNSDIQMEYYFRQFNKVEYVFGYNYWFFRDYNMIENKKLARKFEHENFEIKIK